MRAAQAADAERLRELTFESKAHWGYDRDFVRRWADGLAFESPQDRWVAEIDGEIVAWAGLVPPVDGVAVLDDLWVDPSAIGHGLGSRLFRLAADRARELGAKRLEMGRRPERRRLLREGRRPEAPRPRLRVGSCHSVDGAGSVSVGWTELTGSAGAGWAGAGAGR